MGSVFLRKDTGSWVIQYRDPYGKLKTESIGKKPAATKGMARKRLDDIERSIKNNEYGMSSNESPTLKEITPEYIKYQKEINRKRSWKKDQDHLTRLNKIFGDKKLSEISSIDIDAYKRNRVEEVSPSTVNRELAALRHLYNVVTKWKKYRGVNPVSEAGLFKEDNQVERILTYDEEVLLLEKSANHLKPILIMALKTAMRKGEVLSLFWSDIDFENALITVRKEVSKSNKARRIPISSRLKQVLLEQRLKTGFSEYVFLNPEGQPYLRHDSLKRCFEGACKRANIKGLRFHDLRHTAATRMIEKGANIVAVSRILGHADLKTTMRYAHPDDTLKDAVEVLSESM